VNGRLHHIGTGSEHARTAVPMLVRDLHVRIINAATGELIRELTIDPGRDYQPPDLFHAMDAYSVRPGRAESRYGRSEQQARLTRSGRVWRKPGPLSLGLSLIILTSPSKARSNTAARIENHH
jgi:hypothetical protein